MSNKQCVNCPGAVDHSTAECPVMVSKPRPDFLALAESNGARITGKPDGSEPIEIVFSIQAWRSFDAANARASLPVGVPDGWRPVPVESLTRIARFIDPAPVRLPNGDTMVFKNPHAAEALREISAEFRDMLVAVPAAPTVKESLSVAPTVKAEQVSAAARDILAERQRQITAEGWTPEHDDEHNQGELAVAAACYAFHANREAAKCAHPWPWQMAWHKPTNERRDLVKAGALILAEIERLDRAEQAKQQEVQL